MNTEICRDKMTGAELAEALGISRTLLWKIRKRYPVAEQPADFNDVAAWRQFLSKARTDIRTTTPLPKPVNDKLPSATESNIIFVAARAKQKAADAEIRQIQLAATKREVVRQEEVIALFAKLAAIVRGRLMKLRTDLPNVLLGLDAAGIDKVLAEKMDEALASLAIPEDFFDPRGLV